MLKAPLRILIVAALCVLALITLVVREGMARDAGTEVLLAMEAVDPRELLQGHYVTLRLQEALAQGEPCPENTGRDFWLVLAPNGRHEGGYSLAASAPTHEAAPTVPGAVLVRGQFTCWTPGGETDSNPPALSSIQLDLGFDRFYVNQTQAQRIERVLREQRGGAARVYAIASIGQDGRARLKGLMVDGERLELSWL